MLPSHTHPNIIAFDIVFYLSVCIRTKHSLQRCVTHIWRFHIFLSIFYVHFRYADVSIFSDHHFDRLWMHSNATKFKWKMFIVLFGDAGIRLYIVVRSSTQQFELYATIAMRFSWISRLFYTVFSISMAERDKFRLVAEFSVSFFCVYVYSF